MKSKHLFLTLTVCILALGCAATTNDYTAFYAHQPRSILVVPILNETVQILAPNMLITSVSQPLGERGYYVFPVILTDALLKDLGLPEAGLIHQLPPKKFQDRFGADAVLFITIKDWGSKYVVLQNIMRIEVHYALVDTRTGNLLWDRKQVIQKGSGGDGLLSMAISAAVDKLITEAFDSKYRPLAKQLNLVVFTQNGIGLPAGSYHPKHGKDRSYFPVKEAAPTK